MTPWAAAIVFVAAASASAMAMVPDYGRNSAGGASAADAA
jgi:hypothetical protein